MATLETLNPAQPADTEAVALGAQRMRQERDAIITTIEAEHHLDGSHKIPQGVAADRPAAVVGKDGRIFIDIERETLEQQIAGIWSILHAIRMENVFSASAAVLSPSAFIDAAVTAMITSFGTKLIMIGQGQLNNPTPADEIIVESRFNVDGTPITPSRVVVNSGTTIPIIMVGVYDAGFGLLEGAHAIGFQVRGDAIPAATTMSNRQLTIIAF